MSVAVLFSPQGSQVVGMGRDLADASTAARDLFRVADAALDWSVSSLCWDGPAELLDDTRQTQPCLVTTSLACLAALGEACADAGRDLAPSFVAGHSIGEYAALTAAGVVSTQDAIRLAAARGARMAEAGVDGSMAAVLGLERGAIGEVLARLGRGDDVVVANDNAPGQVVISGTDKALEAASEALREAGAKRVITLRVSGPFHSPHMAPVGLALAAAFQTVAWHDADPPLISNVTAQPVTDAAQIRSLLARQVSSPVEWVASVRRMVADGVDTFVECGPGNALTGMVRRIAPQARTFNVSDPATLGETVEGLAQVASGVPAEASV